MKHINQVEVRIPEDTTEFLQNALDREEQCVSVGGLAAEVGLLRASHFSVVSDSSVRREVAARLRLAREWAGLSGEQVDKLLDFGQGAVVKIESGERTLTDEDLPKLARAYGVDVAWLVDPDSARPRRDRLAMAARELGKLEPVDLERVIGFISSLQTREAVE
jgi:transcriptional regulator with XRE-family HTH domain